MVVSIEGEAAVSIYFVKRLSIIRMYRFPRFAARRGPIQSVAITSHAPETAWAAKVVLNGEHPFSFGHKKCRI